MLASFRPLHVLAMPSPVPCLPRRCCHARSDMTRLHQQGTGHETLQMRAEAASGAAPSLAAMNSRSQHDLTQRHANIRARSRNRTHAFATDSTDSSASAERPVSDLLRALSSATRPLPLATTTHPTDERSMPTIGVTSYYVPPSTLLGDKTVSGRVAALAMRSHAAYAVAHGYAHLGAASCTGDDGSALAAVVPPAWAKIFLLQVRALLGTHPDLAHLRRMVCDSRAV